MRGKGRIVGCGDKKFTKLNINDATLNWSGGGGVTIFWDSVVFMYKLFKNNINLVFCTPFQTKVARSMSRELCGTNSMTSIKHTFEKCPHNQDRVTLFYLSHF